MSVDFELLEQLLGYTFKNRANLETALTHSSFVNELNTKGVHDVSDNEVLEFFGDSILNFIISEYIVQKLPALSEGNMSKLRASIICEKTIAQCARKLELGSYLRAGTGLVKSLSFQNDSILADAFEAVVAAIYIDGGIESARKFLLKILGEYVKKGKVLIVDSKSQLLEYLQKNPENKISFELISIEGPDHNKRFIVELILNGEKMATGKGTSIKAAEQNAAGKYLMNCLHNPEEG